MDHNKPNYEHPRPPLVSEMKKIDLTAPSLVMAKHAISPFPGAFFRVAFESNPRPRGPYMGLVIITEGPGAPGAGLGAGGAYFLTNNVILGLDLCEKCFVFTFGP